MIRIAIPTHSKEFENDEHFAEVLKEIAFTLNAAAVYLAKHPNSIELKPLRDNLTNAQCICFSVSEGRVF